jgi:molecular chaperone GrpE
MRNEDTNPNAQAAAPATEGADKPAETTPPEDAEMAQLQNDVERFKDLAMRAAADLDNFRKRAAREKQEATHFANARLLEALIPIVDHFELGLSAARAGNEGSSLLAGMEMVARQLQDFLAAHSVQPVDAAGQKFDPNLHEAIAQEESREVPEGFVIRQLRKGYKLRDRLLRPANVVVSKGKRVG